MLFNKLQAASVLLGSFSWVSHAIPTEVHLEKRATVDDFIATESPIAYAGVIANIGSSGSKVSGAASGVVIASPSKSNPDCKSKQ